MTRFAAALTACALFGCSHLPSLRPASPTDQQTLQRSCQEVFPSGRWVAIHSLEAHMPLGNEASFLAVVAPNEGATGFRSALLSLEGFTLFEATYKNGVVTVQRAVPPLDRKSFGTGMTEDVGLLLFPPAGELVTVGYSEQGEGVCRYQDTQQTVDVLLSSGAPAKLRRYQGTSLVREAELTDFETKGFAKTMTLRAFGLVGYSLRLTLLSIQLPEDKTPSSSLPQPAPAQ